MRASLAIALALGAVLGGAAVLLVTSPRELIFPHAKAGPETTRVLVAKTELGYSTRLKPEHLQWVKWPKKALPPGSFTSVEALFGEQGEDSRFVLRTIEPGEPILEDKITKPGESPRMSMNLGNGKRAVAVSVDTTDGVAGVVSPGERVDIMLVRSIEGKLVSSIILQAVPVIAVGQRSRQDSTSAQTFRTVTFEVDNVQAQKLALAQQVGRLSLTLRGLGDEQDFAPPDFAPPGTTPCKRPWSGYKDIPPDILIPDIPCYSSLGGSIGPALRRSRPIRVRRGDFGVPRGLDAPVPRPGPAPDANPSDPPRWPWLPPVTPHG